MNAGLSAFKPGTVSANKAASAASFFGGKNSNEIVGTGRSYNSRIRKTASSSWWHAFHKRASSFYGKISAAADFASPSRRGSVNFSAMRILQAIVVVGLIGVL